MSGADKYTESAPPLNFDQAFLDAQLKKQPGVGKLQAQILSQNTYDKWTGQGFGSVRNTAKDMAQKLWDAGITRLEDFGQRKVMGPPTMGYDENIGPVEVPGVERYEYYNKATGKPIESGYATGPNTWGGTYRGDGSTAYNVQFTESGMPIFYAGYGGSSSDWGTVSQILSFASFIPGIGPFAAALNAIGQAYNGNYTGAVLSALSAGAGYYGEALKTAQGADAAQAAQAAESLGVTVEQLQAAGYAAQSGNTAELAKIFGGIRTAQQATSVLMALDQKNLAGVINGLVSMAPQIGITIPEEVMKPIQVASIGAAVSRGDLAGALQSASTLTGNSDLTLASKGAYLANAIKSGNPVSILSGFIDFQKTSETLSVKSFQDAAKAIGLPMSTEEATKIVNSPDYKKDVSLYNSTVKKAQEAYAKETGGGQLPPEFFEQHNITDLVKAADDLYTTPAEAKSLWAKELGYTPSEFDLMELEGLATSDVRAIIDNKTSTTQEEAEGFLKNLYGDRYEPSLDEVMSLMGLPERDAQKIATEQFNEWTSGKNTTTGSELESMLEKSGLKMDDLTPEQVFKVLSMPESGASKYVETITSLQGKSFDASGFDDPKEAAKAAQAEGYTSFVMTGGDVYKVMSPVKEGEIKDEVQKKQTFGEAFAAARKELGAGKTFSWTNPETGVTKSYTTNLAAPNAAVPFDASKSASKEDAALLAAANGKLSFTYDGKTYGMDMKTASALANSQNQSAAETQRLLAQAVKPATDESLAETQRLMEAGNRGVFDQVLPSTAQLLNVTTKGLGSFVANVGTTYAQLTGDTSYSNALTKAGADIEAYAKQPDSYGLDVQRTRVEQARKQAEDAPFFEKIAIIGAAAKNNFLGFVDVFGPELVEELPETAAQIGVAILTGGGSMALSTGAKIISSISLTGSFLESFGGSGKEAYQLSKARGDSDEVALNKSWVNATLGFLSEAPGDLIADKALVGPMMKAFAEKTLASVGVGFLTSATAGAVSELVSGTLQNYATQMVVDPATASWNKAVTNGVFEMFIGGTVQAAMSTPGSVVDTARVIGRDYLGNDVTLKQVIDGNSGLDISTVSSDTEIARNKDGDSITVGSSVLSGDDLGIDYAKAAEILPPSLTGVDAVVAYNDDGAPVTLGEVLELRTAGDAKETYTDYLNTLLDTPRFSEADASTLLKQNGIANPTPEQVKQFAGFGDVLQKRKDAARYADEQTTSEAEARLFFKANGITNPTPEQLAMFVGEKPDAQQRAAVNAYADPLATTESEARAFFRDIGITNPTSEQISQYVGARPESDVLSMIARDFGTKPADTTIGGQGTDTTTGTEVTDTITGTDGTDTTTGTGGSDTVTSTGGTDTTTGTNGTDITDIIGDTDQLTQQDITDIVNGALKANPSITEAQVQAIIDDALAADDSVTAEEVQNIVDSAVSSIPAGLTESAVQKIVGDAIAANPSLTETQVQKIVTDAMAANPGISAADVANIVNTAVSAIPAGVTETAVQKIVNDAMAANPSLTESQVKTIVTDAIAANPGITSSEVEGIVNTAIAALPAGVTETAVQKIVDDAMAANPSLTESQVQKIVSDALAANPGISAADVTSIVNNAVSAIPTGVTESAVQKIVGDALAANPSLTESQVQKIVSDAMTANPGITASEVANIVNTAVSAIPAGVTESAVQQIVSDALAANPSLTESQIQTIVNDALAANPGISAAEVKGIVDSAVAAATEGTSGQISELEAQTKAQYESLTATQKAAADALVAQGQTLQDAITAAKTETAGQIAGVETRLTDAIAAAEAMGLSRDQAITAAVESVAAELGTTKEALLGQLGTTEAALRSEFAAGLSNLGTQTQAQYDSLTAAQKATADALVAQGQSMQQAVATVQGQITDLATQTQAAFDTLTADQKALVDALTQQGVDLSTAITTVQSQVTDLATTTQKQYETLTAAQKAIVDTLTQQGTDLSTAIATAQQQTQTQIAELTADTQAKFDSLTQSQKDLATQLTQQGVDINTAIAQVQQQTQQQFTGLETRVNELMTQGQTYQQATQTAINELTSQNTQLAGQIGTQGRTASQLDIDTLTQMLGGQRSMDLSYDVTGDRRITQDDIDFLTRVVSGANPDWRPPADSAWGPTGLYGQLAKTEAQRQADLQAQLAREEAVRVAEIERQRVAAEEAQRQGKIANIRGALSQGQQAVQSFGQQLPQALKQSQEVTTPLYGTMEYFDPFGDPFAEQKMRTASSTNPADQTKMAAGGYIDDLLAGEMTVDDLLNLLR